MPSLTSAERRALRAKAHHLTPVVLIGQHGLTPAVQHEIDVALLAHELIKVRVHSDDRGAREALGAAICSALACENVQHLGKMLVFWRPNPDKTTGRAKPAASKAPLRKTARKSTGAAHGEAREDSATRRRLRDHKASGAPAPLPYFSRRGAGRFVASTPDAAAAGKAPAGTVRSAATDAPRKPGGDARRRPTGAARDFPPAFAPKAPRAPGRRTAPGAARNAPGDSHGKPRTPRSGASPAPRAPSAKSARRKREG